MGRHPHYELKFVPFFVEPFCGRTLFFLFVDKFSVRPAGLVLDLPLSLRTPPNTVSQTTCKEATGARNPRILCTRAIVEEYIPRCSSIGFSGCFERFYQITLSVHRWRRPPPASATSTAATETVDKVLCILLFGTHILRTVVSENRAFITSPPLSLSLSLSLSFSLFLPLSLFSHTIFTGAHDVRTGVPKNRTLSTFLPLFFYSLTQYTCTFSPGVRGGV